MEPYVHDAVEAFEQRVRKNQAFLVDHLSPSYDMIVCGSGTGGSVVSRRLADAGARVLLLEAGSGDDAATITEPGLWGRNLGTERDWGFVAQSSAAVNGRSMPLGMGRVLGGGSSINAMIWARGHASDWDEFARLTGDPGWSYRAILDVYRDIEDWQGVPDARRRGTGGLVHVEPAGDPSPIAHAFLDAAREIGMPVFDDHNGEAMEGSEGASLVNLRVRDGRRLSMFRTYVHPVMDRANLVVLSQALVTRIVMEGDRAIGVEVAWNGRTLTIGATKEVVLACGAIQTPKLLMQSGIGAEDVLHAAGVRVRHALPGVGRNFQDHIRIGCVWESPDPVPRRNNGAEATCFHRSLPFLVAPDLQTVLVESPVITPETAHFGTSPHAWTLLPGLVRPQSRGYVAITGHRPGDPVNIATGALEASKDVDALVEAVAQCRALGNSQAMRPFVRREIMPGPLSGSALRSYIRDSASTYWHQAGTARMGSDAMSVVDANLRVHGVRGLRIADSSVMPRVTTGNTMAPCVVIGEKAARFILAEHGRAESGSQDREQ